MRKSVCIITFLLLISIDLFANDIRITQSEDNTVKAISGKNTNVVLEEVVLEITLHQEYYEVSQLSKYYNQGPDEHVSLGSPFFFNYGVWDYNNGYTAWTNLMSFESYINDNRLDHTVIETKIHDKDAIDQDYLKETKWYIREVLFPGKKHTYSRVSYTSKYEPGFVNSHAGIYDPSINNWKDSIEKITIIINHGDEQLIRAISFYYGEVLHGRNMLKSKKVDFEWESDGKYRFEIKNIEPEQMPNVSISLSGINPGERYGNIFGEHKFGWIWDSSLIDNRDSHDMEGNGDMLLFYTRNQLKLFINFFYAFHGYDFQDRKYKEHFQGIDSFYYYGDNPQFLDYYKVNPDFSEDDFNEYERKNIDFLMRLEKLIPAD